MEILTLAPILAHSKYCKMKNEDMGWYSQGLGMPKLQKKIFGQMLFHGSESPCAATAAGGLPFWHASTADIRIFAAVAAAQPAATKVAFLAHKKFPPALLYYINDAFAAFSAAASPINSNVAAKIWLRSKGGSTLA